VAGVTDLNTLVAAVLHDTIEDTETTADELEEKFGPSVRDIVVEQTDDKVWTRLFASNFRLSTLLGCPNPQR
jgi:(p)ppGpp synthase/HD superfamily hydrolase